MKLRPKLLELKPGTRIVSNSFTMEDWEADETANVTEDCTSWCTALLWIVPAKVEGTWQMPQGELTLTQEFQMLSGTLGRRHYLRRPRPRRPGDVQRRGRPLHGDGVRRHHQGHRGGRRCLDGNQEVGDRDVFQRTLYDSIDQGLTLK